MNNTAVEKDGGAIYMRAVGGTLAIRNATFQGNKARNGLGGAIAFGATHDPLNAVSLENVEVEEC